MQIVWTASSDLIPDDLRPKTSARRCATFVTKAVAMLLLVRACRVELILAEVLIHQPDHYYESLYSDTCGFR